MATFVNVGVAGWTDRTNTVHKRVYSLQDGVHSNVIEWMQDGSGWVQGPGFPAGVTGKSVGATGWIDSSGTLHIRVYVEGDHAIISEYVWDGGPSWQSGTLPVVGHNPTALSWVDQSGQLNLSVYVLNQNGNGTLVEWQALSSGWTSDDINITPASASPVTYVNAGAAGWTDGNGAINRRVYSVQNATTNVIESVQLGGTWTPGGFLTNVTGASVAATAWAGPAGLRVYVGGGDGTIVEYCWDPIQNKWTLGTTQIQGNQPTALSWVDQSGNFNLSVFALTTEGYIVEWQFDPSTMSWKPNNVTTS